MKNLLILLIIVTLSNLSCVEDARSYNCSDLNELKVVFEKRIEKYNETITILKYAGRNEFERKMGDSLIQLEKQFEQLFKIINNESIERISSKVGKTVNQINNLPFRRFKESFSVSKVKKEAIEELNTLMVNFKQKRCSEYNELKLFSIQESLVHSYLNSSFTSPFYFNSVETFVYSNKNRFKEGDSLLIEVGFKTKDTTDINFMKYWVDDSTMNEINQINHNSNSQIVLKGKKGKHKAEGYIAVKRKGVKRWKKWKYDYIIE